MARLLLRLEEALPDRSHPLVGRPTVNAALISGGSALNAVPDRCEVIVDRRTLPGETWEEVRAPFDRLAGRIRKEHPEFDLDVELREWTDAAEAETDTRVVGSLRDAVTAVRGTAPEIAGFTGITDARFYLNDAGIPAVICGPGSLSVAHTADEWVGLDELADAARIYAWAFVDALGI
jgi:acetylornithine deacetylase/succinyl-diaminopimelate desuccinylase-like protein